MGARAQGGRGRPPDRWARVRRACAGSSTPATQQVPTRPQSRSPSLPSEQAQQGGELVQLQDDASYALDGLAPTSSLATQRDCAVSLCEMLSTRKGRLALRCAPAARGGHACVAGGSPPAPGRCAPCPPPACLRPSAIPPLPTRAAPSQEGRPRAAGAVCAGQGQGRARPRAGARGGAHAARGRAGRRAPRVHGVHRRRGARGAAAAGAPRGADGRVRSWECAVQCMPQRRAAARERRWVSQRVGHRRNPPFCSPLLRRSTAWRTRWQRAHWALACSAC